MTFRLNTAQCSALLFGVGLAISVVTAAAQTTERRGTVIKPREQGSTIKAAAIDDERFEIGGYLGALSVDEFNTNLLLGASFAYHLTPRVMAEINHARSEVDRAAFEDVLGGDFVAEDDREFVYSSLSVGFGLMQGRSFLGARRKYNSHLYVLAGAANVTFAAQDQTGFVWGITYKTVLTDWLVIDLDLRDTVVDRDFLNQTKTTHNVEAAVGFNILF